MEEKKFWNEPMETMAIQDLRKLQMKKLKKQIRYIYEKSPHYYKKKFDEIGARPEDIKTWEDFRNLPIMRTKEEDRESQKESLEREGHPFGMYLCADPKDVIFINSTSGTTGEPTFTYLFTENDIKINDEVWQRVFWRVGIRPGDAVLHAFGLSMWVGGIPVIHALQKMGVRVLAVGAEGGTEKMLKIADQVKPRVIGGTPAIVEHLIERCPEVLKKDVKELGIELIYCAAAPGAGLPHVRKRIEDSYGCRLYDASGGAWGLGHVSCDAAEYTGMHVVCEDYSIWYDLQDPRTGGPIEIKDGAIGHGVITSFEHEASPAFKYAMGDLVQIYTDPCSCGSPGFRFKILSRIDDLLIVKGVNVYPAAVKNVLSDFIPRVTGEMRILLDEPGPGVEPPLRVKAEYGSLVLENELPFLKKEIENKMSASLGVRPNISLVPPNTLERASGATAKGKLIEKLYE